MAKGNRRSKNFTAEGFQPVQNKAQYEAMQEKRRSSAAGTHDSRPNRQRSRAAAKQASIKQDW